MKKSVAIALILVSFFTFNIKTNAVSASSYAVIEQASGRILYQLNGDIPMPMASTTKVMTAVLVIENLELSKEYDIPDEAVGIEGSSIYLQKGEKLTGEELLYGLMMASGNDAAHALAIITSGSTEAFVELMNNKAMELGLTNTKFSDPCGLKSEGHYTSANDLARLCAYAMDNELFKKIVSTQNYQIRGAKEGEVRNLYNKNRILGEFEGGNGIKTGYTRKAGRCLCSSAERNGMQIICVVLNDYNWFEDSKALMERAFSEYSLVQTAKKEEIVTSANIFNGFLEKCDIITKKDAFYPLKKGEYLRARYNVILEKEAPVVKGESAGNIDFYLDGEKVLSVPCTFNESVRRG